MPNPPSTKPGTFPYEVKWLITHYALDTVSDEGFKEQMGDLLHRFPMDPESAATSITKYLHDKEKYGRLTVKDIKHIADLIFETDSSVGRVIYEWVEETFVEETSGSGLKIADKVVAQDDVVERAKGMGYDISGIGTVEQLKDVGMPTEQALVAFPNHRGWIYLHELRQPFH